MCATRARTHSLTDSLNHCFSLKQRNCPKTVLEESLSLSVSSLLLSESHLQWCCDPVACADALRALMHVEGSTNTVT